MQKKKPAITDLNAPNGSRDIRFQSQEFGQNGHRHFVGVFFHISTYIFFPFFPNNNLQDVIYYNLFQIRSYNTILSLLRTKLLYL